MQEKKYFNVKKFGEGVWGTQLEATSSNAAQTKHVPCAIWGTRLEMLFRARK
jgi:hypothetical protein